MMRHKLIFLLLVLGFLSAGCTIHEVPEGGDDSAAVALSLDINLSDALTQLTTIRYSTKASSPEARYIVRFYPWVGDHYITDTPFEFVKTETDLTDRNYTLSVIPMNYHVEVWADWTSGSTPFYSTTDFGSVGVNTDPYSGGELHRDAFFGSFDLDLSGYPSNHSIATAEVTLHRPNARFNFVSTDKEEFILYWASEVAIANGTNVKDPDAVDLSKFRVVVTYPQYMPSVFNVHDGVVADSATGVSFETKMKELADGTIEVAWDWVLANDEDASVVVTLSIYDPEGGLVNRIENIQIPLSPGRNTTVTGRLLSSDVHSGIVLDPSFDGEYVVFI